MALVVAGHQPLQGRIGLGPGVAAERRVPVPGLLRRPQPGAGRSRCPVPHTGSTWSARTGAGWKKPARSDMTKGTSSPSNHTTGSSPPGCTWPCQQPAGVSTRSPGYIGTRLTVDHHAGAGARRPEAQCRERVGMDRGRLAREAASGRRRRACGWRRNRGRRRPGLRSSSARRCSDAAPSSSTSWERNSSGTTSSQCQTCARSGTVGSWNSPRCQNGTVESAATRSS